VKRLTALRKGKTLVGSAANTIRAQDGLNGAKVRANVRPNPMALEVPVVATGTHPSDVPGERDLFTEETSTVLVFRDGAVIRLSATVALGQLVFLTSKQSKREVVCQVLRKRRLGPTGCYVELDFTEEIPDFWGVEFPADESMKSATSGPTAIAEEMVEATDTNSGEVEETPTAPSLPEVDHLRQEVETLRNQLQSLLQTKEVGEKQGGSSQTAAELSPVRKESPAWARAVSDAVLSGVTKENQKVEVMSMTEPAPGPVSALATTAPAVEPPPVNLRKAPAPFAEEEETIAAIEGVPAQEGLLPQPALDFSKAPKQVTQGSTGSTLGSGWKETLSNPARLRILALVGLLLGGGGVAWYGSIFPFLPRTKANVAAGNVQQTVRGKPMGSANAAIANANGTAQPGDKSANVTVTSSEASKPDEEKSAAEEHGNSSADSDVRKKTSDEVAKGLASGRSPRGSRADANSTPEVELPESAMADGSVVPAKLLKSVSAVYPPDAMRNYITGDVIIDTVVHANGQVGEMKVLTGPAALREAATDALKKYQYAPATQGGKPVASHVKVTVKFWFNP
jgi:TonB family protein